MTMLDLLIKRVSERYYLNSRFEIILMVWEFVRPDYKYLDPNISEEWQQIKGSLGEHDFSLYYKDLEEFLNQITYETKYEREQLKLLLS